MDSSLKAVLVLMKYNWHVSVFCTRLLMNMLVIAAIVMGFKPMFERLLTAQMKILCCLFDCITLKKTPVHLKNNNFFYTMVYARNHKAYSNETIKMYEN